MRFRFHYVPSHAKAIAEILNVRQQAKHSDRAGDRLGTSENTFRLGSYPIPPRSSDRTHGNNYGNPIRPHTLDLTPNSFRSGYASARTVHPKNDCLGLLILANISQPASNFIAAYIFTVIAPAIENRTFHVNHGYGRSVILFESLKVTYGRGPVDVIAQTDLSELSRIFINPANLAKTVNHFVIVSRLVE